MTDYVQVRDAVVTTLRGAFDSRVVVAAHGGGFSEAEIRRLATRTPAILTALMGVRSGSSADARQRVELITWVLARADSGDRTYNAGLKLVSALVPFLARLDEPWSIGGAESIDVRNLYTGSLGQMNVCLWAIRWDWELAASAIGGAPTNVTGGIRGSETLDVFAGVDATHDIGGNDVTDTVTIPGRKR